MSAWAEYRLARHPNRPSPRYYVETTCGDFFELHGDRAGNDDPAVLACIGRFKDRPIVVAAFDRKAPTAAGFRKAIRGIELAGRLHLPLVTIVDTPGADPRFESEYSGLAAAIARTFEALLSVESPVISIITGEGGSGGALALACGDVVAIQEHAVFSVIAPEGAAEILHRDTSRAAEVADQLRPTAAALVALGLADLIIPEPQGGAHLDPRSAALGISRWLGEVLPDAVASPGGRAARFGKVRSLSQA